MKKRGTLQRIKGDRHGWLLSVEYKRASGHDGPEVWGLAVLHDDMVSELLGEEWDKVRDDHGIEPFAITIDIALAPEAPADVD